MKKIIIISALILMPFIASAQRGISRSNNVSVSSTIVTKTTIAPKTYNAKVGFQQMAGINLGALFDGGPYIGISYVGGYRFNDWLFAGGGIEYNLDIEDGFAEFNLPVYAQVRTYFTKRIWRPYVSLSLGGCLSHNDIYDDYIDDRGDYYYGFYGDFSFGVDAHVSEKFNVYLGLGINNMGIHFKTGLSF